MAQASRNKGKAQPRPRSSNGSHEPAGSGRDYSIAAVGRALDLLEALSRIGPRRWQPWPTRPVVPARPASACCAPWRPAASRSRTKRAGCGGSAPAGAFFGRAAVEQGALEATAMPFLAAWVRPAGKRLYSRARRSGERDHRNLPGRPGPEVVQRGWQAPATACRVQPPAAGPRTGSRADAGARPAPAALHAGHTDRRRLDRCRSPAHPHARLSADHR